MPINPIPLLEKTTKTPAYMKKIFIIFISIIVFSGNLFAQDWSREDSLWLINVLEGKYDLKINDDTKKAIEDGRLIVPSWMKNDDGKINDIEIISDFDNAGAYDSTRIHSIDPYSMPPAVYSLYILYIEKMDSIFESRSLIISDQEKKMLKDLMPTGTTHAFSFSYYMSHNYPGVVFANRGLPQNLFQAAIGPSFSFTTDFNHLLSMVFSPSYRRKMHNRKHATAYKNYYDTDDVKTINLNERERRQLRQSLIDFKPSTPTVRTSPMRRNGIDD